MLAIGYSGDGNKSVQFCAEGKQPDAGRIENVLRWSNFGQFWEWSGLRIIRPPRAILESKRKRIQIYKEFFMLSCGATFDENGVPPWTRGDFRGGFGAVTDNLVWVVDPGTHPGAS